MRLMTARNPLGDQEYLNNLRRILILIIWIMSTFINCFPFIALILKKKDIYRYLELINLHCFRTLPVIAIVIMYFLLMWTVKKKQNKAIQVSVKGTNLGSKSNNRKMTKIISRVVIALLICYLPSLVNYHYMYRFVLERESHQRTLAVRIYKNMFFFCFA